MQILRKISDVKQNEHPVYLAVLQKYVKTPPQRVSGFTKQKAEHVRNRKCCETYHKFHQLFITFFYIFISFLIYIVS